MKTILVLAQHPAMAEAVRAALSPDKYRLIHRLDVSEAEPLLRHGMVDVCLYDAELIHVHGIWSIEKVLQCLPQVPLLVYADTQAREWEEEAYLHGVTHVLTKPVRARLLNALLDRLETTPPPPAPGWAPPAAAARPAESDRLVDGSPRTFRALEAMRDFSAILTHSLQADAMLKQFLLLLREIIGVNRAAIFLRQPSPLFVRAPAGAEGRRLRSACALGLSPGLLEHFQLSFESGIGGYLFRAGRILRRTSPEAQDGEVQKEFELLGAQVAIPMLDRETLVGVAAFDGRLTGEPLSNGELELIFHLLEELGLAVKNVWLHDQLAVNHEMMADILRQLSSACVLVSRDLEIIHANSAARQLLGRAGRRSADLEFSDLPQILGSKIYQVLKTGTAIVPFRYEPPDGPEAAYHVTVVPFQREKSMLPNAVLLVAENRTQSEQLQRLEIETGNLRLIRSMADRLAHEIGNALVPLSTHQQLLADKYKDPEFRTSLEAAMADSVKRVSRLINQMRFLARDTVAAQEAFPFAQLVQEAFQDALKHQPAKSGKLKYDNGNQPVILSGDRAALKHALTEILLNAIQANPADAKIVVRADTTSDGNGSGRVEIEILDNGAGFSNETATKVAEPFFTTRNVGLGLGLTVSRKIIESHSGKLTFGGPPGGQQGVVHITLPSTLTQHPVGP